MRTSRRPSTLATLRFLATLAVGGGAFCVYLMACDRPTPTPPVGPGFKILTTSPLPSGMVGSLYCTSPTTEVVCGNSTQGLQFLATADYGVTDAAWTHQDNRAKGDTLPTNMSLSSSGLLTGSPTEPGTVTFSVQVSEDIDNLSGSFTITIAPAGSGLTISPTSLPAGTLGVSYSQSLSALGGVAPYTWTEMGTVPPGLTLSSGGVLAGVPTQAASFTFTAVVTDAATPPNSGHQGYTVVIATAPALVVQTNSLTFTAMFGEPSTVSGPQTDLVAVTSGTANGLSAQISYGQGATPWLLAPVFSATSTPPNVAVQFAVNPVDAGLPPGSYSATVTISSTTPGVQPVALTVNFVVTPPVLVLGTNPLTFNSTVGAIPPSQTELVTTSTGVSVTLQSATIAYVSGAGGWLSQVLGSGGASTPATLPVGMSSAVQGLPANTYAATVTFRSGETGVAPVVLNVNLVVTAPPVLITTTSLPPGTVGLPFNNPITATGGTGTYTFSVVSGSAPTGLVLNSNGTWTGVPTTTVGSPFNFAVRAASGAATSPTQAYSVTIQPGCSITPSGTLASSTVGVAYSLPLAVAGTCTTPGNWGITNNPPGLSLAGQVVASTTETLEGTPTTAGRYLFTIGFTDGTATTTAFDTVFVEPAPNTCAIVPVAVPDGTVNTPYGDGTNNVLTATSQCTTGSNPAQWTWSIASTPPGLSLVQGASQTVPTATLQGTPTTASSPNLYTFVVTFRNGPSDPGVTQSYTININPAPGTARVRTPVRAAAPAGRSR